MNHGAEPREERNRLQSFIIQEIFSQLNNQYGHIRTLTNWRVMNRRDIPPPPHPGQFVRVRRTTYGTHAASPRYTARSGVRTTERGATRRQEGFDEEERVRRPFVNEIFSSTAIKRLRESF